MRDNLIGYTQWQNNKETKKLTKATKWVKPSRSPLTNIATETAFRHDHLHKFPKKLTSADVRGQLMRSNSCRSSTTLQWSLQNRAHLAQGLVGVETGPVGKSTTGHNCSRLEIWVAYPEISGCPSHTAYFSSNFPASSFPAVFTCVQAA